MGSPLFFVHISINSFCGLLMCILIYDNLEKPLDGSGINLIKCIKV